MRYFTNILPKEEARLNHIFIDAFKKVYLGSYDLPINLDTTVLESAFRKTYLPEIKRKIPAKTGDTSADFDIKRIGPYSFRFTHNNPLLIKYLEGGTKEHIIKAKDGGFLMFKKGKRKSPYKHIPGNIAFEKHGYIFAKMVRHPGFAGRHFLKEVLNDDKIEKLFHEEILNQIYKNLPRS